MKLDISLVSVGLLEDYQSDLLNAYFNNELPGVFDTDGIDAIIYFLHYLYNGNEKLVTITAKNNIIERDEDSGSFFEKSIRTIVKNDIIYKLLNPEKKYQKRQENDRLSKFLSFGSHNRNENIDNSIEIVANGYYKRFKAYFKLKLSRAKKHKRVVALKQKYPNVDIERVISYGILTKKINAVNADIEWLDDMISIINPTRYVNNT